MNVFNASGLSAMKLLFTGVRLAQMPDDIKPFYVAENMDIGTLKRAIYELFAEHYTNLDEFDLYLYTHIDMAHGIYQMEIRSINQVYNRCIITVLAEKKNSRTELRTEYDNIQSLDGF